MRKVTIIDLAIQNILSVENAFRVIGADVRIGRSASDVDEAEFLVLPGVGAFGVATAKLKETGLGDAIYRHAAERKKPLMGLCLGMQLLAESSEEYGVHAGLGLVPGRVIRLEESPPEFRVPNIGWRPVSFTGASPLFPRTCEASTFYHVHSFHLQCTDSSHVAGVSRFGEVDITSAVHCNNIFGTQFHPEKSQDTGLDLLDTVLRGLL